MNGFEKLLKVMAGDSAETSQIVMATMESANTCKVGALKLDADDLVIAHHLTTGWQVNETTFIEPLQAGDKVLVVRLSDELYAVMERVV